SASTASVLTESTWLNSRTSRRRRGGAARSRKRLEVSFASPTGPASPPSGALSRAARASFFCACLRGLLVKFVEKVARQRIARRRDVALGEDDLEEVRAPGGRAEHLGAAVEIDAPDAAEALVEFLRIEPPDRLPAAVEALGPDVERERVMAAQVFHIQHLEAGLFHLDHHVGEARDPAAREDVLADEVIGLEVADVADEVYEAEPAGLERARMGLDEIDEAVAPGVLEAADRHDLVILAL